MLLCMFECACAQLSLHVIVLLHDVILPDLTCVIACLHCCIRLCMCVSSRLSVCMCVCMIVSFRVCFDSVGIGGRCVMCLCVSACLCLARCAIT